MRLLTAREHSSRELRSKLGSRGYAEDEIEQVLVDLAAKGLQSERRFAQGYTEIRIRKGYGPLRISAELREKGIGDDLIAETLDQSAAGWPDLLRRVHDQKYGSEPAGDRKELARRARFLEYRGFPSEMIGHLLLNNDY